MAGEWRAIELDPWTRESLSKIRQSTIAELQEKVRSGYYGKFLTRLTLTRVRNFRDHQPRFDFPVTTAIKLAGERASQPSV